MRFGYILPGLNGWKIKDYVFLLKITNFVAITINHSVVIALQAK